jgi:hypothetical protein
MRPENPPASLVLVHGAGSGPWDVEGSFSAWIKDALRAEEQEREADNVLQLKPHHRD